MRKIRDSGITTTNNMARVTPILFNPNKAIMVATSGKGLDTQEGVKGIKIMGKMIKLIHTELYIG
jgi:hypothetical protein